MRGKRNVFTVIMVSLFMTLMLVCSSIVPVSVQAASFQASKPKLVRTACAYTNTSVRLKWTKVKGAKKYEIYRAKVNPKTGKAGVWKKWAATKKISIVKKASGDYKYRIRAVSGKKKSKWSPAIRIFAARGQITNIGYSEPSYVWGFYIRGQIEMRVLVTNKTASAMGFVKSGSRIGVQNTIYALDKSTGKVLKTWSGYLDTGSAYAYAKQVNAGKSQSVYFYAYVTESEWAAYKNCKFMITSSFYPNPTIEPMSTQMALTSTPAVSDSAIAGK